MCLLAVVALAGTGCSDTSSPAEPEAVQAVVTDGQAAAKEPRATYISYFQLHSIYVDMGPDGTYDNGYDLVLTNPGPKATGLFLQSEIRQNQYTVDAGGSTIFCSALDGVLAHGTCNMLLTIQPPPVYLALAPAQFRVRLMQRRADNSLVMLDSRTFDVVIVHS
jgi:hypothetical protein